MLSGNRRVSRVAPRGGAWRKRGRRPCHRHFARNSLKEHVEKFTSPYKEYDVLIYTGLGLMGRELINIRSSDIVIVTGGRCGTLGEFSIAYEEGKLIGVLTGTGGITAVLSDVEKSLGKRTGAEVIYDTEPEQLIAKVIERYKSNNYKCPCQPSRCRNHTAGSHCQMMS